MGSARCSPSRRSSSRCAGRLSLLRLPDFRCLGAAMLLGSIGMIGEVVVLGWVALELTNSPFLVGVAMGARSLPLFFVGVPAGVLADRFPRHRLLMATIAGQAVTAATLGVLMIAGALTLPRLLTLTLAAGVFRAVEHAARQSYAHDVVGPAALVNGLAVLGIAMRSGWLVGALGAGAIIAHLGSGMAYLVVAAFNLAGAAALLPASPSVVAAPRARESVWQGVLGFITLLLKDRVLLVLMILTAGAEVLGFAHQALLPSLARDVLKIGPEGLGALNGARAVGGVLALGAAASMRGAAWGNGAFFLSTLVFFGASLVALGLAPHAVGVEGVLVVLVIANAAGALADLLAQTLLQLNMPSHLRGQAGGAWVVAIGLAPLGQLQIGALASLVGVSAALGTSGFALMALAGALAFMFPRVRRL